jgi:hypothetical protein
VPFRSGAVTVSCCSPENIGQFESRGSYEEDDIGGRDIAERVGCRQCSPSDVDLDPVSAGSLCTACTSFVLGDAIIVGPGSDGVMTFSGSQPVPHPAFIAKAQLALSRVWSSSGGHTFSVNARELDSPQLRGGDLDPDFRIGTLQMPGSVSDDDTGFLDVTSFVRVTQAP